MGISFWQRGQFICGRFYRTYFRVQASLEYSEDRDLSLELNSLTQQAAFENRLPTERSVEAEDCQEQDHHYWKERS